MKAYGIAKYLTVAEKRAIVGRTYTSEHDGRFPRCASNQCPLGVALAVLGAPPPDGCFWYDPPAIEVGRALARTGRGTSVAAISRVAGDFIQDWDSGHVAPDDLAAALGLTA